MESNTPPNDHTPQLLMLKNAMDALSHTMLDEHTGALIKKQRSIVAQNAHLFGDDAEDKARYEAYASIQTLGDTISWKNALDVLALRLKIIAIVLREELEFDMDEMTDSEASAYECDLKTIDQCCMIASAIYDASLPEASMEERMIDILTEYGQTLSQPLPDHNHEQPLIRIGRRYFSEETSTEQLADEDVDDAYIQQVASEEKEYDARILLERQHISATMEALSSKLAELSKLAQACKAR